MYLANNEAITMTPASSNGSSSATALPSHSVASSKMYEEPERGRSLSRSSSHSSSSGSGVLILPTPSSIDGQSSTGSHYPRYAYGVPLRIEPSGTAAYNPTYLYQVDGRSSFPGSGNAQPRVPKADKNVPTSTESTAQRPDSAQLPIPLGDAWGLFGYRSLRAHQRSPDLFGARTPRGGSPASFQAPLSPNPYLPHMRTPELRASSPFSLRSPRASSPDEVVANPYVNNPSPGLLGPRSPRASSPGEVIANPYTNTNPRTPSPGLFGPRSPRDSRYSQNIDSQPTVSVSYAYWPPPSVQQPSASQRWQSWGRPAFTPHTRSRSPTTRPPYTQIPIVHSHGRSRSHSRRSRSYSPASPIIVQEPYVVQPGLPSVTRPRSPSHSTRLYRSPRHHSRSPPRSRSPIVIVPGAPPPPQHPTVIVPGRARSRSHSPRRRIHYSVNSARSRSPSPPPQIMIAHPTRTHSRSSRRRSPSPARSYYRPGDAPPIIIQAASSSSRSRSRSRSRHRVSSYRSPRNRGPHVNRRNYSPSTATSSASHGTPIIIPSNGPTVRIQEPQTAPQPSPWDGWGAPPTIPTIPPPSWPANPQSAWPGYVPSVPLGQPWIPPIATPRHVVGEPFVPISQPYQASWPPPPAPQWAQWTPAGPPPNDPWMDWDDGSVYGENLYPKPWLNLAKHPRFYHADGNLTVIIGDMQYKLHRYLFKKCSWFFHPNGEPTYLLGFTHKDFDHFLSILYPQDYSEEECKTAEEWTSVLTVAVDAGMQDIRRLAIKRLTSLASPVDKIALGHRYNIKEWLGPAYLALAMRKEPISSLEGAKIGIEALVRVAALKDEVFANLTSYVDQNKFSELFASKLAL